MYFGMKVTPGGFTMDEVASALQKTIRRGEEAQALFWASEIDLAGNGNYCWKRLRIICSEDVGLADPHLPATIRALYENWLETRKDEKDREPASSNGMLYLLHAVLLLCRAPKSRIVDNACNVFYAGDRAAMGIEIPDYAVDHHTGRGRRMGRIEATVYDESYRIENCTLEDPYLDAAKAIDVAAAKPSSNGGGGSDRRKYLAALHIVYKELGPDHGDDGRGYGLALASEMFGRTIRSSSELTASEAGQLLSRLRRELPQQRKLIA